jgi:hypothetical protein
MFGWSPGESTARPGGSCEVPACISIAKVSTASPASGASARDWIVSVKGTTLALLSRFTPPPRYVCP